MSNLLSPEDLLTEALANYKPKVGRPFHGIPDWKPTANVWLKRKELQGDSLIGLFIEHRAAGWPTARRLVRATMGMLPGLPTKTETMEGRWPYSHEGSKVEHSRRAQEFTEILVELDSEGLHSHAAKRVRVGFDRAEGVILSVCAAERLELSDFNNVLVVEAGTNIWAILDRECKVRIKQEVLG